MRVSSRFKAIRQLDATVAKRSINWEAILISSKSYSVVRGFNVFQQLKFFGSVEISEAFFLFRSAWLEGAMCFNSFKTFFGWLEVTRISLLFKL